MRNKLSIVVLSLVSLLNLFAPASSAYAVEASTTETCNVLVGFHATVPASVQQGSSFTITNITVQPSNSYGFSVQSSVFTMSATNTSSSTYSQNFTTTSPAPTTGHNTYVGIYPNWSLNASGPAGSSIDIQLKSTLTVVAGYGTVPCTFSKILATIPITAPPAPSPTPTPTSIPTPTPASGGSSKSSSKPKPSVSASAAPTPAASASPTPPPSAEPEQSNTEDESVSVVPLNVQVRDSSGKVVKGAQVTVDGAQKSTTDTAGRVTFSNVLTGAHAILVSYRGQNISQNVRLTTADVGTTVPITLSAAIQPFSPAIIAGIVAAIAAAGVPAAMLIVRRMHRTASAANKTDVTLSTIMDGSAVRAPAAAVLTPAPAIQVFEPRSAKAAPAPWEPAPVAAAVEQSVAPVHTVSTEIPASSSPEKVIEQPQAAPTPQTTAVPVTTAPPAPVSAPAQQSPAAITPSQQPPTPTIQPPIQHLEPNSTPII